MSELSQLEYQKLLELGLPPGRTIKPDKNTYVCDKGYDESQGALVLPDISIGCESRGVIWNGDVDLNIDAANLKEFANLLGEPLYMFYGNIGDDKDDFEKMVERTRYVIVNHKVEMKYKK